MNVSTDFDGGGSVDLSVDGDTIDATQNDPGIVEGYSAFRIGGTQGNTVTINWSGQSGQMPDNYRLLYHTEMEPGGEWTRMSDGIAGGAEFVLPTDTVYVATMHPYPYQATVDRVNELDSHPTIDTEVIGQSDQGDRDIHIIRIIPEGVDPANAKHIMGVSRQHAGETQGGYHMDGAIDWILSRLDNVGFDEDYVFHMCPNANPDGIHDAIHRELPNLNDMNRGWIDGGENTENKVLMDYFEENVDNPHWGLDHHAMRNKSPAIYSDGRVDEQSYVPKMEEMESILLTLDGIDELGSGSSARAYFYQQFGIQTVTTESWIYDLYHTEDRMHRQGERLYKVALDELTRTVEVDGSNVLTDGDSIYYSTTY